MGGRENHVCQVHCPNLLTNYYSQLLTLDEKDPKRLFEGNALIRRLVRVGVLDESRMKLDYVLALNVEDFLERRLQTCVFKLGLAKSIHHARVLIRQRHIRYGLQLILYISTTQRMVEANPLFLLALENKSSMFLRLLFVSTPRSTLILLSLRPLEVDVLDVSRERSPRVVIKRMMKRERTRKKSRFHAGITLTSRAYTVNVIVLACQIVKQ